MNIENCYENQYKLKYKENFYYCEDPICDDECPIKKEKAYCKKKNNNNDDINIIGNNLCECYPGYDGKFCENKVYIEIK